MVLDLDSFKQLHFSNSKIQPINLTTGNGWYMDQSAAYQRGVFNLLTSFDYVTFLAIYGGYFVSKYDSCMHLKTQNLILAYVSNIRKTLYVKRLRKQERVTFLCKLGNKLSTVSLVMYHIWNNHQIKINQSELQYSPLQFLTRKSKF